MAAERSSSVMIMQLPRLPLRWTVRPLSQHQWLKQLRRQQTTSAATASNRGAWVGLHDLQQRTQGSLIPTTLAELDEQDTISATPSIPTVTSEQLKQSGKQKLNLQQKKQLRRNLHHLNVPSFYDYLQQHNVAHKLQRRDCEIFQLNVGLYCNQACNHCHVESSPKRKHEQMTRATADRCLELLAASDTVHTLDLTGGAPDLCDEFRYLVTEARKLKPDLTIIDRCNLTALLEPNQSDLATFLKQQRVTVIASLPCYTAKTVNMQRGQHVFDRSIRALHLLNEQGYGIDPALQLSLVFNPAGASLPPNQNALEKTYKDELYTQFGIVFNHLLTITNIPIQRFADFLHRRGELQSYMTLLVNNFNGDAVGNVMCTNTVSVDYMGNLYDCDFNQQIGISLGDIDHHNRPTPLAATHQVEPSAVARNRPSIHSITSLSELTKQPIATDAHCFGCTAGAGSSCQGAVT